MITPLHALMVVNRSVHCRCCIILQQHFEDWFWLMQSTTYSLRPSSQQQQYPSQQRRPMLLTRWSFRQRKRPAGMILLGLVEPCGPWLSKTPLFASVRTHLISKCCHNCYGWAGFGWLMRKIRVKTVQHLVLGI
jgi:hypothetical protein